MDNFSPVHAYGRVYFETKTRTEHLEIMDRRESLKTLGLSTLSAALLLDACRTDQRNTDVTSKENVDTYARYDAELERLKRLEAEPDFFDKHEMETLIVLGDIIIPEDDVSGSASEAGVPEFIAFIVKDMPEHQLPLRGGIKWLDRESLHRFGKVFTECDGVQQLEIVEDIAYPAEAKPEMRPGVKFFDKVRSLTMSGFYTSKIGLEDVGYMGNTPHIWKGVPKSVVEQYKDYLTDVDDFLPEA